MLRLRRPAVWTALQRLRNWKSASEGLSIAVFE